jgi:hypothetical protein
MVELSSSVQQIGSMMAIDHVNLGRFDLNLLVALDALLAERSVTRAAARVGLGQSAMSHNLARLRALFGDELLTRGPEGMRPTPRALALAGECRKFRVWAMTMGRRRPSHGTTQGAGDPGRAARPAPGRP